MFNLVITSLEEENAHLKTFLPFDDYKQLVSILIYIIKLNSVLIVFICIFNEKRQSIKFKILLRKKSKLIDSSSNCLPKDRWLINCGVLVVETDHLLELKSFIRFR